MGNRIKLPNMDFAKARDGIGRLAKDVAKFVGNHREKFLGDGLLLVSADGIRVLLVVKRIRKPLRKAPLNSSRSHVSTKLKSTHCGQRQNKPMRPTGVSINWNK